jgi:HJR/Mrr/RecB family endonuclease
MKYRLEYCDSCFLSTHFNSLYKQYKMGKNFYLAIGKALHTSILLSSIITGILILFLDQILKIDYVTFTGSFIIVFFGSELILFRLNFLKHTAEKAYREVSKELWAMNNTSNNILVDTQEKERIRQQEEAERIRKKEQWNRQEKERLRREKERFCGIDEIDQMDGYQFEKRLKYLFEDLGYKVDTTPKSGDQGVDLIIQKENKRIAIQAKRYGISNKVGNSAIQEVHTGKDYYGCSEAWVVTTSYFTKSAFDLAQRVKVDLIHRKKLIDLLIEQNELHHSKKIIVECPECGAKNNVDINKIHQAVCGVCRASLSR